MIQVRDEKTNKLVMVKTALLNGTSDVTNQQQVTGYNVPVTVINGLEHSTYTVTITHIKPNSTASGDTVYLDGFRVYGTLDYDSLVYEKDSEDNPEFVELRDAVLTGLDVSEVKDRSQYADQVASEVMNQVYEETGESTGAVVLSDNDFTANNLQDLLDNGPKNELYLWPNQSVVFKLNASTAQIGLKALNESVTYTITGQDTEQSLNTSTDMFYNVDTTKGAITITNNGEGILSITEIKAFGVQTDTTSAVSAMFMELDENDLIPALMTLGFELEPTVSYSDATVNIHLNDYTGTTVGTTSLVDNGEAGTDVVFTAEDIKTVIEQALPAGYALVDEAEIKDQATTYGSSIDVTIQVGKVAKLNVTYKNLFGKKVGTATLIGVQTSKASQHTFPASEIRKAAPSGYWTGTLISTKVKYGSTGTRTVIGF